ncbi:MAG: CooT family nickel-binding protein [Lachnospiraceae bacterium]|nr:CooT family nickel-binding protein [Lachnospiraceae bacterium]
MCLSTVYKLKGSEQEKICEYISKVENKGNEFVFTDVMGEEITVKGTLKSMDFVKNVILLED